MSFEEALKNLASRLTGVPASTLPRTQEGIVQFMAENLPPAIDVDGLAEAVTAEVIARLGKDASSQESRSSKVEKPLIPFFSATCTRTGSIS